MPLAKVPPVALLGVMLYGLPETAAVPLVPALDSVTEPMVSPFCRPLLVKAVPARVGVWPYVLLALSAVTLSGAGVTVRLPLL